METPPTVETTELVVHVVGAVVRPGVVRLPEFSRVEDALAQAGGPTAEAQLSGVNLAREIFDGEQIVVPVWGQEVSAATGSGSGPISLSRADQAALETLPRVGPATAQRIIAWRESNGPFRSVEDLLAVSGIGPATLEGLADLVVP
jgi:competence protein ComEA